MLLGVLVTGSLGEGEISAEVWLADGRSCSLPDLPQARYAHTQSGMTGCGGFGFDSAISSTCITFNGEWEQSHVLTVPRQFHVSWRSSSGILLLGGIDVNTFGPDLETETTTELLSTMESTSTSHFDLPYITRLSILIGYQSYVTTLNAFCRSLFLEMDVALSSQIQW